MCLAVPARVVSLDHDKDSAEVMLGGVRKPVSTILLNRVSVDDYVLVHVGYALHVLDPEEAETTLALMREAGIAAAAPAAS